MLNFVHQVPIPSTTTLPFIIFSSLLTSSRESLPSNSPKSLTIDPNNLLPYFPTDYPCLIAFLQSGSEGHRPRKIGEFWQRYCQ